MSEHRRVWLLIVLPVVVAILLLVPLGCVTMSGLCPPDAETCPPSTTRCYSLVGVPAADVGWFGVALAAGGGAIAYRRSLRR